MALFANSSGTRSKMVDIVEVFWDARPTLRTMNAKVGSATLAPEVERVLEAVRQAGRDLYPGSPVLVRITTTGRNPERPLSATRNGAAMEEAEFQALSVAIEQAVANSLPAAQDAP